MSVTLEMFDGFDIYEDPTDLTVFGGKWGSLFSFGSVSNFVMTFPDGRFGSGKGKALKCTPTITSSDNSGGFRGLTHVLKGGAATSIQFGFALQHTGIPGGGGTRIAQGASGTALGWCMGIAPTNVLGLWSTGASSSTPVLKGLGSTTLGDAWHWVEVYLSAGGVAKVWLDGNLEINLTGQTLFTNISAVAFGSGTITQGTGDEPIQFDDLYIALPGDSTSPLGDSRVEAFLPTSTVDSGTWAVQGAGGDFDAAVSDWDEATYVYSATVDDEVIYASTGTLEGTPNVIHAFSVNFRGFKDDAGNKSVKSTLVDGADQSYSTEETFLGTGSNHLQHIFPVQPDGTSPWDKTSVEATSFGIKVQS